MRYLVLCFMVGLVLLSAIGCSSSQSGVHRTAEWREPVNYGAQPEYEQSPSGRHASAGWQGVQDAAAPQETETPWRLLQGKRDRNEVTRYVRAVVTHQSALNEHTTDGRSTRGVDNATRAHIRSLQREVNSSRSALTKRQQEIRKASNKSLVGHVVYGEDKVTGWDVINSLVEYELAQNSFSR